jgi:PAS domain S-box-containing protein
MSRSSARKTRPEMQSARRGSRRHVVTILIVLVAAIISIMGLLHHRNETARIRTERGGELAAIAEIKVGQIVAWRNERLSDVSAHTTGLIRTNTSRWLTAPDPTTVETGLTDRLRAIRDAYGYQNAILSDLHGGVLLTLDVRLLELEEQTRHLIVRVVANRQAEFGGVFRCSRCDQVHLDVAAPMLDESGQPFAVLILRCNPDRQLYPLIQNWPLPSETGETLLVRRDGEDVLFLNRLRHRASPALTIRIPLSNTDLLATRAIRDETGLFEGRDYRGETVLADLRPVPGSPWFMIAKLDTAEVLAEARARGLLVFLLVVLAVALTGGTGLAVSSRHSRNIYRRLLQAEQEKSGLQEEIRSTLYSIADGVIATDATGSVTRINPAAEGLTGWTEAEGLGRPLGEVFRIRSEETALAIESPIRRALEDGLIVARTNHTELLARGGQVRPIAHSSAPVRAEGGAVQGAVLVFRDQTAERAAETKLLEREAFVRSVLDSLGASVAVLDRSGLILRVNSAWEKFARDSGDATGGVAVGVGADYLAVMRGADAAAEARVAIESVLAGDLHEGSVEYPCHSADRERWFLLRITSLPGDAGGAVLAHIDITDTVLRKKALAASEEKYRTVVDNIGIGVSLLSRDLEVLTLNRQMRTWFPTLDPEVHPICHECFNDPPREEPCTYCPVVQTFEDGTVHEAVTETPSGDDIRHYRVIASPILDDCGKVVSAIEMVEDITEELRDREERDQLQAQVNRTAKLESVGRLAGGIAHDFNNMLQAILGFSDMVLADLDSTDPMHAHVTQILLAGQKSAHLTRQLLAFARKEPVTPLTFDLNDAVSSMQKLLRSLIGEHITLVWTPTSYPARVFMDPSHLDQILANLAVNARDASEGIGTLTIETGIITLDEAWCRLHPGSDPGEYVSLTVRDTGVGMDAETLAKAFDPFFTTKPIGTGTGLGLASVHGIVTQCGGFIDVHSEPTVGTDVQIHLPRAQGALGERMTRQEGGPARGYETVLFVEDVPAVLMVVAQILERLGYTVLKAPLPSVALALAREHDGPIQLLLTDVVMPEMNGVDLQRAVEEIRPGIATLFISGHPADVITGQGLLDLGQNFLRKPFSEAALAARVRDILSDDRSSAAPVS